MTSLGFGGYVVAVLGGGDMNGGTTDPSFDAARRSPTTTALPGVFRGIGEESFGSRERCANGYVCRGGTRCVFEFACNFTKHGNVVHPLATLLRSIEPRPRLPVTAEPHQVLLCS